MYDTEKSYVEALKNLVTVNLFDLKKIKLNKKFFSFLEILFTNER